MANDGTVATWHTNPGGDDGMGEAHTPVWRRMIEVSGLGDLSNSDVLDFGCNQGGFLRLLHATHRFRSGVGIDIARDSVARAEALKGDRPLSYHVGSQVAPLGRRFDLAFSHEVLYLLPDLAAHARDMAEALRPGASYIAAMGCHRDMPLWPRWRELIASMSTVKVQDHSLEDVAVAFADAGFGVAARSLQLEGFLPVSLGNRHYPRIIDLIRYYTIDKVLFRFTRG